jgi:Fe2+ or Zn2+ uptake regulation protein
MKQRETRQLKATLAVLAAARDHLTAEQVYRRVRRHVPGVSLGTVYRNLDKLRAQGRVRVLQLAGGPARYDPTLHEHDHFVCEACGTVTDLDLPRARGAVRRLARAGFVVRTQTIALYGLCRACAAPPHGPRAAGAASHPGEA